MTTWETETEPTADARAAGTAVGPSGPWYSLHTGTMIQKLADLNALRDGQFRGEIYPCGVRLERKLGLWICNAEGCNRGEITSFSDAAARRLRTEFLTGYVPGFNLWAFTLTTHGNFTPVQWRSAMKRMRMTVKRAGWAGLWRVELQKRKAPHAHVALWLPPGTFRARVADAWLRSTGEENDPLAEEHAVVGRMIPQDESGWAVYMALHDGKHKEAQLGWLGKQWGVWNGSAFARRDPERFELDRREHAAFLRVLVRYDRSKREALVRDAVIVQERPRLRKIHRGNLLRCLPGEVVARVVSALKSGAIYPARPV